MKTVSLLFILITFFNLSAQDGNAPASKSMADLEMELTLLGEGLINGISEKERLTANEGFTITLRNMLSYEEAFDYPFEKVKNLSKLKSENKVFRMFTWLVPLKDGTYNYYGLTLVKRKSGFEVIDLKDASKILEKPEYDWLKPNKWFGAIYYQTFEVKHKKKRYQIFLGYRPGNREVQEKIIDVVYLDGGKLTFGAKIFETPVLSDFKYEQRPYRLRFRYSKKIVASLKYLPAEKMIIMDHLSAPDASLMYQWKYYGPDFSYDGLYWEDGKFYLKKQVQFNSGNNMATPVEKPKQGLNPKKEDDN